MCCQRLILLATDDGIHEEAAGIARHLRVGQFSLTNVDNDLPQLRGSRFRNATTLQFSTDIAVVQVWLEVGSQLVSDMGDEIAVLPVVLEAAIAVSVLTVGIRESAESPRGYLHGFHLDDEVFHLHTVCTDILYGTGTHVARYQRQVLHAVETLLQTHRHSIVEDDTAATNHSHALERTAFQGRMYHNTLEVTRQQQIAAATYDDKRGVRRCQHLCYLLRLFEGLIFQEAAAPGIDAKRIVCQKAIVAKVSHVIIFLSFHLPPIRLKVSSISRPLAMPRSTKTLVLPSLWGFP